MVNSRVLVGFVAAPAGWRVALRCPEDRLVLVVPVVGWLPIPEDSGSIMGSELEPVVLFDDVGEPIISTVADTSESWRDGSSVYQVLAPGREVREVPEGWSVQDYGQ
ncbi:hypothetical protein ACFWA9_05010 [Kitasatospora sp. NPDC059973]|uniref:hypothetical protein n=1 Tax=Kitasatospora sp. NPDC059973 TaxID=3347020 RepID=UPI0036C71D95